VAAPHAELAEPAAGAGGVGGRAGQLVSAKCLVEVMDGLLPVAMPGVQDGEVFCRGGLGPRVMVLRGGLGQVNPVPAGKAQAVSRGRGDGREPRVVGGEGFGGADGHGGQLIVARCQCSAHQPGHNA